MSEIEITNQLLVGANASYSFRVGQVGKRWVGFAFGGGMIFFFPAISEGHQLGILDKDKATRLTGAIAEDENSGYGGIDRWSVPEELRGKPDDFRCKVCDEVGCSADHSQDDFDEYPYAEAPGDSDEGEEE